MKKILTYISFIMISIGLNAQLIEEDLISNSQYVYSGSARFNGLGGAMGALGGDLTAVSINPAGAGVFRSGQFSITPTIKYATYNTQLTIDPTLYDYSSGDYYAAFEDPIVNKSDDFDYRFRFDQLGVVFGNTRETDNDWVSFNIAMNYNKLIDHFSSFAVNVPNVNYSFLEVAVADMNLNNNLQNDFHDLAWNNFLINLSDSGYYADIERIGISERYSGIEQKKVTSNKVGEYNISFGANYAHKLYLGVGVSAVVSRYWQEVKYTETNQSGSTQQPASMYDYFDFNEEYSYNGVGVNMKFGAIYRPVNALRLGVAVQTPTVLTVEDDLRSSMRVKYIDGEYYSDALSPLSYTSNVSTPFRATGSVALVSRFGLISADYEFVDYSKIQVRSDEFSYSNTDPSSLFRATHNIRIGAEGKAGPMLIRAGYNLYQNPWKEETDINAEYGSLNFGVGFHQKSFFLDLAYKLYTSYGNSYDNFQGVQYAVTDVKESNFQATIGFKF